ncbi:MAG: HEAT repeat domain-containing protein [Planctomycetota bacterium]|nr:HEAT repeat domain-containing protein [Planctomycetota bacterium]
MPAILARLGRTRDLDVQRAAVMALAKIGPPPRGLVMAEDVGTPLEAIEAHLGARNEAVQNAAVLSLGIHGGLAVTPLLASIALDEKPGRAALGRTGRIDRRTRAFAAHALGMAGHDTARAVERRFVAKRLLELLAEEPGEAELAAAAVIGLGQCPTPFALPEKEVLVHRRMVFDALAAFLEAKRSDLRARAQAPVALARQSLWPAQGTAESIAARGALRRLALDRLTPLIASRSRTHALVREGVCQALGLLAGHEQGDARLAGRDVEAVAALIRTAREGQEREAGLSMIALARIAGRGPVPADSLTIELRTQLGTWAAEASPSRRPWALLALGILLHERGRLGDAPALGSQALLQRRLRRAPSPEERAAAAIASGLAGSEEAAGALEGGLDEGDFRIRGFHALALSLLPAPAAIPDMLTIVSSGLYRPYLVRDVATALGILGCDGLGQLLAGKLVTARFMPEKVAALQALAWVADPDALETLVSVLRQKRIRGRRVDDTSRAFAIAALGALGSRRPLPFNAAWAQDIVWNAAPPSLHEAESGGGVLDLF